MRRALGQRHVEAHADGRRAVRRLAQVDHDRALVGLGQGEDGAQQPAQRGALGVVHALREPVGVDDDVSRDSAGDRVEPADVRAG